MKKGILVATIGALAVGLPQVVLAEEDGPNFTFGAAASIAYDFEDPDAGNDGAHTPQYAGFEQDESFNIDLIQVGVNGSRGAVDYEARFNYGDLAGGTGDAADGDVGVQVATLTYNIDGNMAVTAGRFDTPIGLEVLEPWGNPNISRSWGWTAQPINHDGLKLSGSADVVDWMFGVANNFTVADPAGNDVDDEKAILGSLGVALSDALNAYVSGLFTQEGDDTDTIMVNGILSGDIEPAGNAMGYAIEFNWRNDDSDTTGEAELFNVAGYLAVPVGPADLNLRVDFTDDEGILGYGNAEITSVTATGTLPLAEGVDARVEYRFNTSNEDIFGDGAGAEDTANIVQAQIVWHPEAN